MGFEGLVLGATSTTLTIPAYSGQALKSFDIRIVGGTGMGQRRTVSAVAEPVTADTGVPTAVNNVLGAITITDTTKNWVVNQWAGYQVRISFGAGVGQVRRIISNTATVLTLGDIGCSGMNNFCNPGITSPAISAVAGTQSIYTIESSVVTVDNAWSVTPDITSVFRVESGMIVLASSTATTPFYTLQYYDILSDTWYIRTANTLNVALAGSDGTIERCAENSTLWDRGSASAGSTSTTLVDLTKNWTPNQWAGYWVRIFSGTGEGQLRQIVSNTQTGLTWSVAGTAPDTTSDYLIDGFDSGTATSGSTTTIVDTAKNWAVNRWANYMVRMTWGTGKGQLVQIASNTATTLTFVRPVPVSPDSTTTYSLQGDVDKIYLAIQANAATLIHNNDCDIASYGRMYDQGIASNAVVIYGSGISPYKPIAIASATHAATTATITTAISHCLKVGMTITVKGMTDANFNTTATILTVPSATTFTYTMAGTPSADTLAGTQSTTTLTDSSKNWTVNQWAGYMVYMTTTAVTAATGLATGQALQIASNTATTLTFVAGTAPINGVSRYVITPRSVIGAMDHGIATGTQSTVLLTDTNKTTAFTGSVPNGSTILTVSTTPAGILSPGMSVTGTSIPTGTVIVNQLTSTMPNGSPGGQGTYTLSAAATALISGASITPGWVVNAYAGRKCKIIGSTGQSQESTITANTANTLTLTTLTTAPVTLVSSYVILEPSVRGAGIAMNWVPGLSSPAGQTLAQGNAGKFLVIPRGGGVVGFDKLDITTDHWNLMPITPQLETLTTGSMYSYDGGDRIYFTKDVTNRCYYLDVNTNTVHAAGLFPYSVGSAIVGNRMEIFTTAYGLKFLWLNRHANLECFRQLLFY
jgi:hypothetical protein